MTTFGPDNGLVITPISSKQKKQKPCSFTDYKEQEERFNKGESIYWDDSPSNKTKTGDLFVFRFDSKKTVLHIVEEVSDPTNRLESWSDNVGQSNRNVLKLSNKSITVPWEIWSSFNYKGGMMGTQYMDTKKHEVSKFRIFDYANERFNSE